MCSINTITSTLLYNRFSQSPAIQKIAVGLGCLSLSKHLLWNPDPSHTPTLKRKIGRKAAGVVLLIGGLAALYYGGKPLISSSIDDLKRVFIFGQNSEETYDRYQQAYKYLDKNSTNLKRINKVLYLGASSDGDPYGALDPSSSPLLHCLDVASNLAYKIIHHPLQICKEIQSAAKEGPVENLVIAAHGSVHRMDFSPTSFYKVSDQLPSNCFEGLAAKARIFLSSCYTGASSKWWPNMAEWISWNSGKEVIAPSGELSKWAVKCFSKDGRLDMSLMSFTTDSFEMERQKYFNTSTIMVEKAHFYRKMLVPTLLGAVATLQAMRFGVAILQGSRIAVNWLYGAGRQMCLRRQHKGDGIVRLTGNRMRTGTRAR